MPKTMSENAPSMNIWSRPESSARQRSLIVCHWAGGAVVAEDRQMRADERDEHGRHQPYVQAEETIDRRGSHAAAALSDVLQHRPAIGA